MLLSVYHSHTRIDHTKDDIEHNQLQSGGSQWGEKNTTDLGTSSRVKSMDKPSPISQIHSFPR